MIVKLGNYLMINIITIAMYRKANCVQTELQTDFAHKNLWEFLSISLNGEITVC